VKLEALQKGFASMSVAAISGNGQCTFKRCVLTMIEQKEGERVPLSVVFLIKPEKAMEMGGTRPLLPLVQLQDCLARGEGQLIVGEKSRPARVKLENTLLVLGGAAALSIQASDKEPKDTETGGFSLELTRVSAFLTDSLLHLRGNKNAKGLVFTTVDPAE